MPTSNRGRCHENIDVAVNKKPQLSGTALKRANGVRVWSGPHFYLRCLLSGACLLSGGCLSGGACYREPLGRRIRGAVSGLGGVLPLVIWGWLVWAAFCRRRFGAGWFGRCSGTLGAGSFAYGLVCRRAGAVGAVVPKRWGSALTPACSTRAAVGCAGKAGMCWRFGLSTAADKFILKVQVLHYI